MHRIRIVSSFQSRATFYVLNPSKWSRTNILPMKSINQGQCPFHNNNVMYVYNTTKHGLIPRICVLVNPTEQCCVITVPSSPLPLSKRRYYPSGHGLLDVGMVPRSIGLQWCVYWSDDYVLLVYIGIHIPVIKSLSHVISYSYPIDLLVYGTKA